MTALEKSKTMLIVGLTGSLGSGKSTVALMFAQLGAKVIDADKIVHNLLRTKGRCHKSVVKSFGRDILTRENIDHAKLAQKVFSDSRKLKKLEAIVHPEVKKVIDAQLKEYRKKKKVKIVVLEIPLLFEAGWDRYVDIIIVVRARQADQLARTAKRLSITKQEAMRRIRSQMPMGEKILLADVVVDNRGTRYNTKKQVKQVWNKLKRINI